MKFKCLINVLYPWQDLSEPFPNVRYGPWNVNTSWSVWLFSLIGFIFFFISLTLALSSRFNGKDSNWRNGGHQFSFRWVRRVFGDCRTDRWACAPAWSILFGQVHPSVSGVAKDWLWLWNIKQQTPDHCDQHTESAQHGQLSDGQQDGPIAQQPKWRHISLRYLFSFHVFSQRIRVTTKPRWVTFPIFNDIPIGKLFRSTKLSFSRQCCIRSPECLLNWCLIAIRNHRQCNLIDFK